MLPANTSLCEALYKTCSVGRFDLGSAELGRKQSLGESRVWEKVLLFNAWYASQNIYTRSPFWGSLELGDVTVINRPRDRPTKLSEPGSNEWYSEILHLGDPMMLSEPSRRIFSKMTQKITFQKISWVTENEIGQNLSSEIPFLGVISSFKGPNFSFLHLNIAKTCMILGILSSKKMTQIAILAPENIHLC